jgi:hypothetical protein
MAKKKPIKRAHEVQVIAQDRVVDEVELVDSDATVKDKAATANEAPTAEPLLLLAEPAVITCSEVDNESNNPKDS